MAAIALTVLHCNISAGMVFPERASAHRYSVRPVVYSVWVPWPDSNTFSGFQAGASAVFKLGPVQIFFISDDIIPFFIPDAGGGLHFRGGINIVPGTKKAKTVMPEPVG
jgi:hypothetical protein